MLFKTFPPPRLVAGTASLSGAAPECKTLPADPRGISLWRAGGRMVKWPFTVVAPITHCFIAETMPPTLPVLSPAKSRARRRLIGLAAWAVALGGPGHAAAEPIRPAFVVSGFDLGAVPQARATDSELATELAASGWCTAKAGAKKTGGWAAVPDGVEPGQWVSVVTVGFGNRADAYAFQFTGPAGGAKLLAHVPHRKGRVNGAEAWFPPFEKLFGGFRIGHAAAEKAAPRPALQLEVVLVDPKAAAGLGGADEALTLAADKMFPPVQAIATAAACEAGWAPTTQKADAKARLEVRVLDQACAFRVTFTRGGRETVLTRDRVPWEEYHDQLALLFSLPVTRAAVSDFARPSPESVALLGVESNRIVCLVDDELTALDTATGAEAWRIRVPQSKTGAKRVERYETRRDAAGKLRLYRTSTAFAESAVADGTITPLAPVPVTAFDVGANGEIVIVQGAKLSLVAKGKEVWAAPGTEPITAGPRLEADRVLVGMGGELVAFAKADRRELWRVTLGNRLWGPVTAAGDLRLAFSAEAETLFAIDPKDGAVKWRFAAGDALAQPPFMFDGSVVVVTKANRIARLNPVDGSVVTEAKWPTWVVAVEPLAVGEKLQLAVGDVAGRLSLVGPDLKKTWESALVARVTGRPAAAMTPPVWKAKAKPAKGGPDDLLDTIAADAAGTKPFLLATDGAGFLYKLSTEGTK